ncbi:thiolase family protein [Dehalococcoidia bacterium]|nr:thiolase family protein [Dehalococcoidia bacterium]
MASDVAYKTAIVGVGTSDFQDLYRTKDPDRTPESIGIDVLREALDDAGLKVNQLDGLITSAIPYYPSFAYRAGLRDVRLLAPYPMSGRLCAVALAHASMAVQAGLADYVALVYSTTMRSNGLQFGGDGGGGDLYDPVYGLTSPGAFYSLAYDRYTQEYGFEGRDELLGAVSLAIRGHALKNPKAVMRAPLTIDEYMEARYIARPFRLFDYCLVTDGAVCYIVTTAERAEELRKPPVYIGGFTEQAVLTEQFVPEDRWYSACQKMTGEVLEGTGLALSDISSLQVYDNFTASALWALEGFGFCPKGEALDWVQNGRIELGGELPINTSGGMLSEAYMQGWNHHAEAVRQIRGECGDRQVADCNAVLYGCLSPLGGATLMTREKSS